MLALKLLGASFICLCGFFAGYKKAHNCVLRAQLLQLMADFLNDVKASIKYRRDNVIDLLCQISAQKKYASLMLNIQQVSPPEWPVHRQCVIDNIHTSFSTIIPKEEFTYFCDAIGSIGEGNAKQEDEKLEFYLVKLSECAEQAHALSLKNKKLYTGVGLFAGAATAIILL